MTSAEWSVDKNSFRNSRLRRAEEVVRLRLGSGLVMPDLGSTAELPWSLRCKAGWTHTIGKWELPLRQVTIWGWRKALVAQQLPMWNVAGGDPNPRNAPCPPEKNGNVSLETGNPEAPPLAARCTLEFFPRCPPSRSRALAAVERRRRASNADHQKGERTETKKRQPCRGQPSGVS